MKKTGLTIIFICGLVSSSIGQLSVKEIAVLKRQLEVAKQDTIQMGLYLRLAAGYRFSNIDSSLFYSDEAIKLADKLDLPSVKSRTLSLKGATVLESGKLPESLQYQFEALKIGEKIKDTTTTAFALNRIGNIYMELADYRKAIEYYTLSKQQFEKINNTGMIYNEMSNIGNVYGLMGRADSALYYQQMVFDASLKTTNRNSFTRPEIMFRMGNAFKLNNNNEKALLYYKKGIDEADIDNDLRNLAMTNLFIAKLYFEMKLPDSSMKYAMNAIQTGGNDLLQKSDL